MCDLPMAKLQIMQASGVVEADWLDRSMLEPVLAQNADGLWVLSLHQQGEFGKFKMNHIGSEVLLADAEFGLVVVLISYHGSVAEKYGRLGYRVQKGQFYRYYLQQSSGGWVQIPWRQLNDELRTFVLSIVEERGPVWAKKPGKLQSEHKPRKPTPKQVEMISYKVVRLIEGRYFSLYNPEIEYVLGQRVKQPAKPKHGGGFFSYPTIERGMEYLADCVESIPFHEDHVTPQLALLECEVGGRIIDYGHKMASTYLCPLRVLEVRSVR